ncbi:unnamed protein product [Ostreobium quekettii]|uniref:Uncharacterized protein n=1 Tax=Ostreobium quekettii TaxID=121088 RepID=A0A8S1J2W1_9CHLO|nr:unnamed protein product [Ostreobium quekettii]|eukprot:evm.model.scf_891.5 EVM.evm.TU.scf_891.5   scf_891:51174-53092(-)
MPLLAPRATSRPLPLRRIFLWRTVCDSHPGLWTARAALCAAKASVPNAGQHPFGIQIHNGMQRPSFGTQRPCPCGRAAPGDLATYPLEATRGPSLLESCAREAVLHLDEAPCLHLAGTTGAPGFTRQAVPESVAADPQLWPGMGKAIANLDPEVLMLVHRVPDNPSPKACLKLQLEAALAQAPGSVHDAPDALQLWSQSLMPCGRIHAMPGSGRDSCHSNCNDSSPNCLNFHEGSDLNRERAAGRQKGEAHPRRDIAFWGIVIQSKLRRAVEGCYLLKTVSNIDINGVASTHFSLNRVTMDVPLGKQLQAAWLV